MKTAASLAALTLVIASAACSRTPEPEEPAPPAAIEADPVEPPERVSSEPPPIVPARSGWIARATLDRVLDAGIGSFLARVEVEPAFDSGRFRGWRVIRYDNAWVDVRPGDILLSVNDRALRTPDALGRLWESLRSARDIDVTLVRDGERIRLQFAVADEQPPATP